MKQQEEPRLHKSFGPVGFDPLLILKSVNCPARSFLSLMNTVCHSDKLLSEQYIAKADMSSSDILKLQAVL